MEEVSNGGLRTLLEMDESIRLDKLFSIHEGLIRESIQCNVVGCSPKVVHSGEVLTIEVENLSIPIIDFYEGEINYIGIDLENYPIYVSFNGMDDPIQVPIDEDSSPGQIRVTVPEEATSGKVDLLIPVVEICSPTGLFFERSIQEGICVCNTDTESLTEAYIHDLIVRKSEEREEEITYYPLFIDFADVKCTKLTCTVKCPENAIEFDSNGDCYVNPDKCKGERYYVDHSITYKDGNREYFKRLGETSCWDCLATASPGCKYNKLRQTLYHLASSCCGNCTDMSKAQGWNIKEICTRGAISGGRPLDYTSIIMASQGKSQRYEVDPEKCNGCKRCFNFVNCYNNLSTTDTNQITMRMGAYIPKKRHGKLYLRSIALEPHFVHEPWFPDDPLVDGYRAYVSHRFMQPQKYTLGISGNKKELITFELDENFECVFTEWMHFTEKAYVELFEGDSPNFWYFFPVGHWGSTLTTKEIEAKNVDNGILQFKTQVGIWKLSYRVKTY